MYLYEVTPFYNPCQLGLSEIFVLLRGKFPSTPFGLLAAHVYLGYYVFK